LVIPGFGRGELFEFAAWFLKATFFGFDADSIRRAHLRPCFLATGNVTTGYTQVFWAQVTFNDLGPDPLSVEDTQMAKQPDVAESETWVEETWLRSMSVEELRRLARFCRIDLGKQTMDREDMILAMTMARRDSELTDALFRDLTRPATAFEVRSARNRLERRAAKEREDQCQALTSTRQELHAEIAPLKNFVNWSKLLAGVLTLAAGYFGFTFWGALQTVKDVEQEIKAKVDQWDVTEQVVKKLETGLSESLATAKASNADSQRMIVALSTQASIQIIGKSIARLDRLRSMKLYHIKPLMEELSLDIESDLHVLNKFRAITSFQQTDEQQIVESLYQLSKAIADLRLIYDQNDELDLAQVRKSREDWRQLHFALINLNDRLPENFDDDHELGKLRTTAYQVEAGLAIQQYRAGDTGREDEDLLQTAHYKCALALADDPNAIMAFVYEGLISSLKISRLRERTMDPHERIAEIEFAKRAGEKSYRQALTAASKTTAPAELSVYTLNNLSYLMVKTSDAYTKAADQPECQDQQQEFRDEAAKLLKLARKEIRKAETKAVSIDPIVLTTHADIEILNLRFEIPKTDEAKSVVYNDIRGLLRAAVENGYSGYQGPQTQFFAKRPHFHNLAELNEDYQQHICQDLGIVFTETIDTKQ
jgi:hypothetical protein